MLSRRISWKGPFFACAAALLLTACSGTQTKERVLYWADGTLREQWTEVQWPDGHVQREGSYRSWYESGQLREEGHITSDRRAGIWTEWYDHPTPARLREGEYVNGDRHGRWVYWHNPAHAAAHHGHTGAGQQMAVLKVEELEHGVPHGVWISWYPDGQVSDSMGYVNGVLDGRSVSYHPNGRKASEAEYAGGQRRSGPLVWDSTGVLRIGAPADASS